MSVDALRRVLRSAGVEPDQLRAVLLVGGSSRIPIVSQIIGQSLHVPVAVDAHPKHSIALGAALTAEQRATGAPPGTADEAVAAVMPAAGPAAVVGTADGATERLSRVGDGGRLSRRWMAIIAAVAAVLVIGAGSVFFLTRGNGTETAGSTTSGPSVSTADPTEPPSSTSGTTTSAQSTASSASSSASVSSSSPTTESPSILPGVPVAVQVSSTEPWTATGVECAPGDVVDITATGTILHNKDDPTGSAVGPDGLTEPFFRQFNVPGMPDANTVAVIGSIDEQLPYFLVGSGASHTCLAEGEIYLGVNDAGLDNNSGEFDATVTLRG